MKMEVVVISSYSLILVKVNQRNFVLIIIGFIWLFMGEPLASVLSMGVCAYYNPAAKLLSHVKGVIAKLDSIVSKSPSKEKTATPQFFIIGSVSIDQADSNAKMNTDNLVPFDRTKIRGRVSRPGSSAFSTETTRPSSSASIVSSGVQLGGDKAKDESNLLNLSGASGGINAQATNSNSVGG
jgi:hypothetical protein